MESFRALVGMKPKSGATDEDIFIEEITVLLEPHLKATVEEMELELAASTATLTADEHTKLVLQRLLKKFFALAKTDSGLNKFMIPIMMYLRSARMKRGIR